MRQTLPHSGHRSYTVNNFSVAELKPTFKGGSGFTQKCKKHKLTGSVFRSAIFYKFSVTKISGTCFEVSNNFKNNVLIKCYFYTCSRSCVQSPEPEPDLKLTGSASLRNSVYCIYSILVASTSSSVRYRYSATTRILELFAIIIETIQTTVPVSHYAVPVLLLPSMEATIPLWQLGCIFYVQYSRYSSEQPP